MINLPGKRTLSDNVLVVEEHLHSIGQVYPTGTDGVVVTGAAGAWTLGAFAEIIPASTVTEAFDLHFVNVESVSAADVYELVLYAVESEICRIRVAVLGTPANLIISPYPIQTPIIAANAQIQAKLMNAGGGSETMTVSLKYHVY